TGPEVVTGSTRMKAGTATKLVLNMVTTAAMVRVGKVYENLMVDIQASCEKLENRAGRILRMIAGVDQTEASRLLDAAGGNLKTALVMALAGCGADEAEQHLRRHGMAVREAIKALQRGKKTSL
ncbi:MAG: N-acetylmuramic acid 6-phosphate etherase, partial [Candidatus Latescibacteria bacterium]|nr:N-acetylmuramic acid 6-phosphate etherase [Candidatus Latescibacterota bacterium]